MLSMSQSYRMGMWLAGFMSMLLEFCDDLTLGTICGKTYALNCQEVCDAIARRPVSEYRY